MSSRIIPTVVGGLVALASASAAMAQTTVEDLEQRIRVLERKIELDKEAAATATADAPVVSAGPRGFSIRSKDGNNQIRFRGLVHFDSRTLFNDNAPDGADSFNVSRVRPTLEGTLGGIYDFKFMPDFGNGRTVLQDAYIVAKFKPGAQLTVGKFKTPFGIERLQSASDMRFFQRGLPNNLVPNRDIGLQLGGDFLEGKLSYAVAYLDGVNDGGSTDANTTVDNDNNNDKDYAARVFAQPFKSSDSFLLRGLGFGIAGTYVDSTGVPTAATPQTLLSGFRTSGNTTFFNWRTTAGSPTYLNGERLRWSPQLYYSFNSFGVLSEYVNVSQDVSRTVAGVTRSDKLDNDAWQVAAGYFITGEDAGYKVPSPKQPFTVGKPGWGAFEVVARYSVLDVDDAAFTGGATSFADPAVSATKASAWAVGVNWYLTQNYKFALNYERTEFDGGAAAGADRPAEEALLGRFQLSF